ncbi:MAG: flagellar basal-body MS-ring/collar protein FliF [Anaerohalosphaeraceae bacterium]
MFEKINAVWQRIGLVQRAVLAAAVMACIITGGLLTQWATRPEMRLLYGNLNAEQAGLIADKIQGQNVECKLGTGGSSIYVPSEKVYEIRAMLAKEGLGPKEGEPGYEIFDNEKLGVSPLVQKLNYNRALQGELAKTIQFFDGVEYARVHIVRPEQTMFTGDGQKASASVMLKLRPGWRLSQASAAAITNLISGAVEGLKPENVTIADSQGNLLTGTTTTDTVAAGANTYKDYKAAVEQQMTERLLRSLELVLGPGKATVLASAIVDMTSESEVKTIYEKGIPEEETVDESSNIQQPAATPDGQNANPGTTEKTGSTQSKYKVPETVTTRQSSPGKITSWSVSIIADLSKSQAPTPKTDETQNTDQQAQAATPAAPPLLLTEEDVKAIVQTAIGPELLKPENLTVRHVPFNRPMVQELNDTVGFEKWDRYIEIARQSSMGVLALCALLALKIFTSAGKKAAAAQQSANALGAGNPALLTVGTGVEAANAIRQHISSQMRQNPEQVRQLFANWLAEDR